MSSFRSTFRTLHKADLKPQFVDSYAGSYLLVTSDQTKYAFDPKGNQMAYTLNQEQKELNELQWRFSFIRSATQNLLSQCRRIVVVGPSTDYYKLYFFADDYRHFKVELKVPEGTHLENVMPSRFSQGRGKGYYNELISLS